MDEGDKGYLTEEETAYGLRAINPSLSTSERTYLFRVSCLKKNINLSALQ